MLKSKIDSCFAKHDKSRITLGDILQNFQFKIVQADNSVKEFSYEYLIVITQDCDLEQWNKNIQTPSGEHKNQFLANILILPAFIAENIKLGIAYRDLFGITQEPVNTEKFRQIKQNKNDRYHFLQREGEI